MTLKTGEQTDIVSVRPLGGYRLAMTFNDGHVSSVDFGPFLRGSLNPETRQFLKKELFRDYSLRDGNLVWGDYAMCFPLEALYDDNVGMNKPVSESLAVAENRAEYVTKKGRHK